MPLDLSEAFKSQGQSSAASTSSGVVPKAEGLVQPGNIKNLFDRPILHNPDGSYSTTLSFSIGTDKGETLIPQVVNGKLLTREQAISYYRKTGENLGTFDTPEHADAYAIALHNEQHRIQGRTALGSGTIEQPKKEPGISLAEAFKTEPLPAKQKFQIGEKAKSAASFVGQATVGVYLDDAVRQSNEYMKLIKDDVRAYPQGMGNQVLHSLKTANDALGAVMTPVTSPVQTGAVKPVQGFIRKLGDLVKAHAAEDVYDAQARREGARGQQYPKGIDWKIHKEDVERTVTGLQDAVEHLINLGVGLVGGKPITSEARALETSTAGARSAVRDIKSSLEVPEPKLTPVSVSLDKTLGFAKISENAGLQKIPIGATRTAASVLDDMLPHAEGCAKEFLDKLSKNIDKDLPIRFKQTAGGDLENRGVYLHNSHAIEIKAGAPDMVHTVTHEMVHASTINMIDTLMEADLKATAANLGRALTNQEKLAVVNKPISPILKELDSVIQEARIRAQKAGVDFYGLRSAAPAAMGQVGNLALTRMSPRYEFVAEIMTNPNLQRFLADSEKYASIGFKTKNLMNQFTRLIAKHLGFENPEELKLLNQAMRVSSNLIELKSKVQPKTNRDITQIIAKTPTGEVITRGDVDRVTSKLPRDAGGLRKAKNAMQISMEATLRAISPESLGRNARLAAAVVAGRIAESMQRTSAWRYGSETRAKFWESRPDLAKEFINRFEAGKEFSEPELRKFADKYKTWNQQIYDREKNITGLDYEPRDNYLFHSFEDSEGVANYFNKKYGSKWGDPKFQKERVFDLYKEAITAGFRPRWNTPEEIMLARQHASDIAQMHTDILQDLEKYGLATLKVKGGEKLVKTRDAEGKMSLEIQKTEGNKQPEGTIRWRAPNGSVYWVDQKADVILSNAFKSKSLWEDKSMIGMGFRGAMALKNTLVPIRLALSLFHPLHVAGIDIAADWTRTSEGLLSGQVSPIRALGEYLRGGFGPLFENPKSGWKVMNVWKGKVAEHELSAADTEALKTIVEGGFIPEMSTQYRTNARQNFGKALRSSLGEFRGGRVVRGSLNAGKAVWHLPWAMLSAMQAPIFEYWIPSLKTASYLKDAKALLARNPELLENDAARQLALRKIAKSVDNRYGEMAYNTLFWKRWAKDMAVLDTLSLGWQLGFLREYGGGAMDLGRFAAGGNKLERIRAGELNRPLFVATYTALGAGVAGLMTWAMTGEYPKDLLDWISPRTGEKNADGSDQRVSTMFYSREFAALYKHMENEGVVPGISKMVLNKGSGLFGLMHEWATGVNDFGQEIRDPDSDLFTKTEQTLAYTLSDLEPISMKGLQENLGTEEGKKMGALSVLGFTPAPKYLTEPKTTADIKSMFDKYVAPKQTLFEKMEFSKEFSALRKAYQSGDEKVGDILDSMTQKYDLSAKDQRRMMKSLNSDLTSEQRMFMRLPWMEQKKLLDRMTEEEREMYLPHANKEHIRNQYEPPAQ